MAAEQNVISVIIESINKMSADLQRLEKEMGGFEQATGRTSKTMKNTTISGHGMTGMLHPLRSVLVQLTGVTGGFGTAIFNLIRFGFTPAGLAITAVIAGTTALISRWISAKAESEEFRKYMDAQTKTLGTLNLEYRVLIGSVTKTQSAVEQLGKSQADQINTMIDSANKMKSIIGALPEEGLLGKLMGKITGISEEDLRDLFGLSKRSQEQRENELSAAQGLADAQRRALKRNLNKAEAIKDTEDRKKFLLQFVGADEDTVEVGSIEAVAAIEKLVNDMEEAAKKSREKMFANLALEGLKDSDILEVGNIEAITQIEKIADDHAEAMKKKAKATAEEMADSFVNDFLQVMQDGTFKIENFFANLGRTIVTQFLRKSISEMLVNPIFEFLKMGGDVSGKGGSIFDIFNIFKLFGAGQGAVLPGNFVPIGPLRKFATGGVAGGPTLGMIGEEGPEIVARMKPARPGDMGGGDIKQNIYLVDSRPPRLGPQDVVLYIAADMRAGGKTANAVQNVIKRT